MESKLGRLLAFERQRADSERGGEWALEVWRGRRNSSLASGCVSDLVFTSGSTVFSRKGVCIKKLRLTLTPSGALQTLWSFSLSLYKSSRVLVALRSLPAVMHVQLGDFCLCPAFPRGHVRGRFCGHKDVPIC